MFACFSEKCAKLLKQLDSASTQIKILKIIFAYLEDDKESIVSWMCLLFDGVLTQSDDVSKYINLIDLTGIGSFSHKHMLLHLVNKCTENPKIFSMQIENVLVFNEKVKVDKVNEKSRYYKNKNIVRMILFL